MHHLLANIYSFTLLLGMLADPIALMCDIMLEYSMLVYACQCSLRSYSSASILGILVILMCTLFSGNEGSNTFCLSTVLRVQKEYLLHLVTCIIELGF